MTPPSTAELVDRIEAIERRQHELDERLAALEVITLDTYDEHTEGEDDK